jgi:NitT/TauT family transport system ATP-binding protein
MVKKMDDAVTVEAVSKSFGGELVLDKVSLKVPRGRVVGIVGPNECGKTTLVKMIAGLLKPDEGLIRVNGDVGVVFQDNLLLPWKRIRENISLGLMLKGFEKTHISKKVMEAANILGIQDYLDKYPNKISGGTARKASIARALVMDPDILLLDEPYTGLDLQSIKSLQEALEKLKQKKISMIIVSHQIEELLRVSDIIYVFSHKPTHVVKLLEPKSFRGELDYG